jgi:hypothetical protein
MKIRKTYIINLKKRPLRLEFAIRQAKLYKFPNVCILKATAPEDTRALDKPSCNLAPSENACAVSHIRIWEEQKNDPMEWVLVLEDDAFSMVPPQQMNDLFTDLLTKVPNHIRFINLGSRRDGNQPDATPIVKLNETTSLHQFNNCHYQAYLIRTDACSEWAQGAFFSQRPIDLTHCLYPEQSSILVYKGSVEPGLKPGCYVAWGVGVFGQVRGGVFRSDIANGCKQRLMLS